MNCFLVASEPSFRPGGRYGLEAKTSSFTVLNITMIILSIITIKTIMITLNYTYKTDHSDYKCDVHSNYNYNHSYVSLIMI